MIIRNLLALLCFAGCVSCATTTLPTPDTTAKAVQMILKDYSYYYPEAPLLDIRVIWKRGEYLRNFYGQEVQGFTDRYREVCTITLIAQEKLYQTRLAYLVALCVLDRPDNEWTHMNRAMAWWGRELLERNNL